MMLVTSRPLISVILDPSLRADTCPSGYFNTNDRQFFLRRHLSDNRTENCLLTELIQGHFGPFIKAEAPFSFIVFRADVKYACAHLCTEMESAGPDADIPPRVYIVIGQFSAPDLATGRVLKVLKHNINYAT